MSKWRENRLGKVAPFKYGKAMTADKRILGEFNVFSSAGICGKSETYLAKCGIVVGRKGSVGTVYYSDKPFFCIDTAFYIDDIDPQYSMKFLYYYMKLLHLERYNNDAAVPGLNRNLAEKLKISCPDLPTQERIANILSAYDDLIEINNRRIQLLEQAAQELYKEWFVRFRFPGHEKAKFENGLPEGWTVKRMNEFCYVTDGTHDTPKPTETGIPLVTGRCISSGFIDFNAAYNISQEDHEGIKKRSGLKSGDILFSNIGTVGNSCIVDYDREFSVKNVIIFKPETMMDTVYLYYWMTSSIMQEIFSTQTNGASQQFVGLTFMRRYKLLVPKNDILDAFAKKILPFVEQKRILHQNNLNLAAQRDLLLPRLMSGKLEV